MKKLVRDRIPEIIKNNGEKPDFYVADIEEYEKELRNKLMEESKELFEAVKYEDIINEIADVWEVLDAIIDLKKLKKTEVIKHKEQKKDKRGGFNYRFILRM